MKKVLVVMALAIVAGSSMISLAQEPVKTETPKPEDNKTEVPAPADTTQFASLASDTIKVFS